jgi:XapX domain-containing protein
MKEVLLSTVSGLTVGALFSFLNLPIPAPPTLPGVMGIIGIYLGFILMQTIL